MTTKSQPKKPRKKKAVTVPGPGRPQDPESVTRAGRPLFVKLMPELDDKLERIIKSSKAKANKPDAPRAFKDRSDFVRRMIEEFPE